LEELFDNFLERREKARVVCCDTSFESFEPLPVAQHAKVFVEECSATVVDYLTDFFALCSVGQSHAGLHALPNRLVTPSPTEDEENCG
jgi:hypothetical protein